MTLQILLTCPIVSSWKNKIESSSSPIESQILEYSWKFNFHETFRLAYDD